MKKEVVQYLWILNIWLVCGRKSWVLTSLWTKYETCKDRKTCKSPSWSHWGCSHVKRKVHCVNLPALMLQWSSSTTSTRMDFTPLVRPYSFEYRLQFFSQQFIFQRKKQHCHHSNSATFHFPTGKQPAWSWCHSKWWALVPQGSSQDSDCNGCGCGFWQYVSGGKGH